MSGSITVANNTSYSLSGTYTGYTISVESVGNYTDLILVGDTTLDGGGTLTFSDNTANRFYSNTAGVTFTNVDNLISGGADIYANAGFSFVNKAAGVVNANVQTALIVESLTITNSGLLEATATGAGNGGLILRSDTIDNTAGSNGGRIRAVGANAHVDLQGATVIGGTISTASGGIVQSISSVTLDGTHASASVHIAAGSTYTIANNTNTTFTGAIDNKGVIAVAGVGNYTDFIVSGTTRLSGGGQVSFSEGQIANRLYSNTAGSVLDNVDNTIHGSGTVFPNAGLSITNETKGVIDGDAASAALSIQSLTITNAGVLQSSGAGGLSLASVTVANGAAGVVRTTTAAGHVDLSNTTIQGGTLDDGTAGRIQTVNTGTVFDGTANAVTVAAGSTIHVQNGTNLTLTGTITQDGTIAVEGVGNYTDLIVSGAVTLSGPGGIALSDQNANRIYSNTAGATLDNVDSTISGSGQVFGNAGLSITNESKGTIAATGAAALIIHDIGLTNAGVLEGAGAGGLELYNLNIANTGTIKTTGAGTLVNLHDLTISGGTLDDSAGGRIQTGGANTVFYSNTGTVHITAGSTIHVNNGQNLYLQGPLDNNGVVAIEGSGNYTDLLIQSGTTQLTGGGKVTLSDQGANRIFAYTAGATLENVDNTITGAGDVTTYGGLSLVNDASGVIDASGPTAALTIHDIAFTNAGLVQASGAGGLHLTNLTVDNEGGVIRTTAAAAHVDLYGATIVGGQLDSSLGGTIQVTSGSTLDSATAQVDITSATVVHVDNATQLTLTGTLLNEGAIDLDSNGNYTDLLISGAVTLDGGGAVNLTAQTANRIFSYVSGSTLDNLNNTVSGSGEITSYGGLTITNEKGGQFLATSLGAALTFHDISISNYGDIEATDGALALSNVTLSQDGGLELGVGRLQATGAGAHVDLNGTTIIGGDLYTGSGGVIQTTGSGSVLDGVHIGDDADIEVLNATNLTLRDTIANEGFISVLSQGNNTDLLIDGHVTLTGQGSVVLGDNSATRLFTNTAGSVLDNVDNTIKGAGQVFSNAGLSLVNEVDGTVEASSTNNALNLQLAVTNSGLFHADYYSTLNVYGDQLSNFSAGVLTGGTYNSDEGGIIRLQNVAGGITTLAADVSLELSGDLVTNASNVDTPLNATLTTIAEGAHLNLFKHSVDWSKAITDSGSLNLNGGFFSDAAGLTITAGGGAGGYGTFDTAIQNDGVIVAAANGDGGGLIIDGKVTGSGTSAILDGASIEFTGAVAAAQTVSFDGVVNSTLDFLQIDAASAFQAHIAKIGADDRIVLEGVTATKATVSGSDLQVFNGSVQVATLHLTGDYTQGKFNVVENGSNAIISFAPSTNHAPVANADSASLPQDTAKNINVLLNDTDQDGDTLTTALVGAASHGKVVHNGNQTFSYTPDAGYVGADSFTYSDSDGKLTSNTATVSLTVTAVNHAPVANPDSYSLNQDTSLKLNVKANDTDVDGNALTIVRASSPAHGTVVTNGDGTFTYTPTAGYVGKDSFLYHVSDGQADSANALVSLTVNAVNHAPTAKADGYLAIQDQVLKVAAAGVLSNDSDPDGNALSAALVSNVAHGALTLAADGGFTYTPTAGYHGTDSFTYQASDGSLKSAPVTVALTVDAPPVAGPEGYNGLSYYPATPGATVSYGSAATGNPPYGQYFGLLTNVTDADDSHASLAVHLVEGPYFIPTSGAHKGEHVVDTQATLTVSPDGGFTFTPQTGDFGKDYFTYYVTDPHGAQSDIVTVEIDIGATQGGGGGPPPEDPNDPNNNNNDDPNNDANNPDPNDPGYPNNPPDNNNNDPQNPPYDPPQDPNDPNNPNNPNNPNPPPQPPKPPYPYNPGGGWGDVHLTSFDGLHFDFQGVGEYVAARSTAGDPFEVQIRTRPYGSTVSVTDAIATKVDGHLVSYDGAVNELRVDGAVVQTDAVTHTLSVGSGSVYNDGASFAVTYPGNGQVLYFYDRGSYLDFEVDLSTARAGQVVGLLGNANGSTGDDITTEGGTTIAQPATFDQFYHSFGDSWRVTDSTSLFTYAPGTSTATYTDLNFPPHPVSLADLPQDLVNAAAAKVAAAGITDPVLRDTTILDLVLTGDPNTVNSGQTAPNPTATLDVTGGPAARLVGIGAVTLSHAEGNAGATPYTFEIYRTSGAGALDVAWSVQTTGFNITSPADAADFVGGVLPTGSVHFDDGVKTATITVNVAGDTALEHNEQFAVALGDRSDASFSLVAPSVQALIVDDDGVSPNAVPDSYKGTQGSPIMGSVLTNDKGYNGEALQAFADTSPAHGKLSFNADGTFTYTPDNNFHGQDYFYYKAFDSYETSVGTAVTLDVAALNHAPIAADDSYKIAPGAATKLVVLYNDSDQDGDTLTTAVVSGPSHGALVHNADNSFTYTPTAGYLGADSFTYKDNDGALSSNTATVTLNVVNQPPTIAAATPAALTEAVAPSTAPSSSTATLTPADPDGPKPTYDTLGYTALGDGRFSKAGTYGSVVLDTSKDTLTYTLDNTLKATNALAAGQTVHEDFAVKVTDGASSASTTVEFTVNGANDPPVTTADSLSTTKGQAVTVAAATLIANDTDPEGNTLSLTGVGGASHGSVSLVSGQVTFTPEAGYVGAAGFTYTADDGHGGTAPGTVNVTVGPGSASPATLAISTLTPSLNEGNSGSTAFTFQVTRSGDTSGAASVAYAVGGEEVTGADFTGGALPGGKVTFDAGQTSKVITINVMGDKIVEGDETFTVHLSGATGASIATADASAVIVADDVSVQPNYYYGANTGEVFDFAARTAPVLVNSDGGDDKIIGGSAADKLNGGDGNDTVLGGGGNDVITGGKGVDRVTGGAGSDAFVFNAGDLSANSALTDVITDFQSSSTERDILQFFGFGAGTHLDFAGIVGGDATHQLYHLVDPTNAANSGYIEVDMVGTSAHLAASNYHVY